MPRDEPRNNVTNIDRPTSVDPASAVGILEAFAKGHPEWRGGATFCLLSAAEAGLAVSYLRLRAYPFTQEVWDFIDACDRVYVVEQNRDGQMLSLLKMECSAAQFAKLRSVRHYVGLPIDGRSVATALAEQEGI